MGSRSIEGADPTAADPATVDELATAVAEAEAPLVVTSKLGGNDPEASVESLVEFAEAAGAGVVESFAAAVDVPESKFDPGLDLSHAAHVVDSYTETVESPDRLEDALMNGVDAVKGGMPAVLDVRINSI